MTAKTTKSKPPKKPAAPKATADPTAQPKPTRRRLRSAPFAERQLDASKVLRALSALAPHVTPDAFERAYDRQSLRRKAKLNDPEYLRKRLAELEGAPLVVTVTDLGASYDASASGPGPEFVPAPLDDEDRNDSVTESLTEALESL